MVPEQIKSMTGLKCCLAYMGVSHSLKIELGDKIFYDAKRFHGEWALMTYSCGWRLLKEDKILCGYYDDYETCEKLIKILEGRILKDVVQSSKYDLSMYFDSNYRLDFWGQTNFKNHHNLFIYGPNDQYFEFKNDGAWSIDAEETYIKGFTSNEKIKTSHSEKFHSRWFHQLPKSDNEFRCSNCAYFHAITGQFYFWDYGLCSNASSLHDGKVVNIKSYCNEFNRNLKSD